MATEGLGLTYNMNMIAATGAVWEKIVQVVSLIRKLIGT